jgi:hypothetical protein
MFSPFVLMSYRLFRIVSNCSAADFANRAKGLATPMEDGRVPRDIDAFLTTNPGTMYAVYKTRRTVKRKPICGAPRTPGDGGGRCGREGDGIPPGCPRDLPPEGGAGGAPHFLREVRVT